MRLLHLLSLVKGMIGRCRKQHLYIWSKQHLYELSGQKHPYVLSRHQQPRGRGSLQGQGNCQEVSCQHPLHSNGSLSYYVIYKHLLQKIQITKALATFFYLFNIMTYVLMSHKWYDWQVITCIEMSEMSGAITIFLCYFWYIIRQEDSMDDHYI